MPKYHTSAHCTYNVGYHIIWCTKYRYSLIRYRLEHRLKQLLLEKSETLGISIHTMETMPNHVHLFVTAPQRVRIDDIVRNLKGYTSFHLRLEFAFLRKYRSLWTRSYFVETVGHISEKTVVSYISSQKLRTD